MARFAEGNSGGVSMASSGADRRKYRRIGSEQVISYAPVAAPDREGVSLNLSRGGIQFRAIGCEIDADEVIRVTFSFEDQTIVAVGRVAWATEVDAFTTEVGLEFLEIDPLALEMLEEKSLVDL